MITTSIIDSYENYGRCAVISNSVIEAYVTLDLGPRVIRYGYVGGKNFMYNELERSDADIHPKMNDYFYPGARWHLYGGHRIWAAPESDPVTYYPDNEPIDFEFTERGGIFTPPAQMKTLIRCQIELIMDDCGTGLTLIHRITNNSEQDKLFSVWAISSLAPGGVEIIPQNTNDTGLIPNRALVMWPYNRMTDERFYHGDRYITLRQMPDTPDFKIGTDNLSGCAMYALSDTVFVKKYENAHPTGNYPDYGCSFETFTNRFMLEMESLGELKTVLPGQTSEHTERWYLTENPGTPDVTDQDALDRFTEAVCNK